MGQEIYEEIAGHTGQSGVIEISIDYKRFPAPGIYFVVITENNRVFTSPIVVN